MAQKGEGQVKGVNRPCSVSGQQGDELHRLLHVVLLPPLLSADKIAQKELA